LKIELIYANSSLYEKLQAFVGKHQLLFSSEEWLKNYQKEHIFQCAILNNNNEVIGCFIYFQFNKSLFKFVISPPFSPHISLFYVNPSESVVGKNSFTKEILTEVAGYFNSLKLSHIDIHLPYNIIDTQAFVWKGFTSNNKYSYLLDLTKSQDELWGNLSSEKRKSIGKASKDELLVQETTDFKLVYSLIIKSLDRNGLAKNTDVIKNILFSFANTTNAFAFIAYQNNQAIGATFCVISNKTAVYLFGGFDSKNKHHGAGVSCMWQSILKAKQLNLSYFDFEGSMNPNIERYFREFGGTLSPYCRLQKTTALMKLLFLFKNRSTS
jgi:hypothetical protein